MDKFKRVLHEISKHKNFLITSHINPEGDSIGSQLAFAYLLKTMGKKYFILDAHAPAPKYNFLPGVEQVSTRFDKKARYDAICFLDCAEIERTDRIYKIIDLSKTKINIDHHISNIGFGDINLILPKASSTAEILYMLFQKAKIPINIDTAICMYAAILTDTGSFNYSNTSSFTHKVAAHLIEIGIDANKIYKSVYEQVMPSTTKLLSYALSTLKVDNYNKIAWMEITREMLKKSKAKLSDEEDFINFPRSTKGTKVAILFKETSPNKIKVSFRSADGIDANDVAAHFGGGGHKKASGCTIMGKLPEVKKKVLEKVKKYV